MPKQLRSYPIYIAPKIKGSIGDNGVPIVVDERAGKNLDPNKLDDKITIYERQVKGWFLNRASRFLRGKDNGFIVLMIGIAYIEGVQEYINGTSSEGRSRRFFKEGLRRIFNLNVQDSLLHDFYEQVRCGLFHSGMTEHKVIINNEYPHPIDFSEDTTIKINPKLFLKGIKEDFNKYIRSLRDSSNVENRTKFNRMFTNLP